MFTTDIPGKSYIREYLENLCGNPVDIRRLPDLYQTLLDCLENRCMDPKNREIPKWNDSVKIIISSEIFYRYGYQLTKTGVMKFNRTAGAKVKFLMRQYIGMNTALGQKISSSILNF